MQKLPFTFDKQISIRLKLDVYSDISLITKLTTDETGWPKYESESHFIRAAVNRLIQAEKLALELKNKPRQERKVRRVKRR